MKKCPCCGYEDTPTERQLLRRYKKVFGDIPVRAMINRGWICRGELASVEEVRAELIRFYELKDAEELDAFVRGEKRGAEKLAPSPAPVHVPCSPSDG